VNGELHRRRYKAEEEEEEEILLIAKQISITKHKQ